MTAISTIKPGDVLYDVRREKMGNTTMSQTGCYSVRIVSIDHEKSEAMASWNGNPAKKYYVSDLRRLVRTPPKGTHEREQLDRERAAEKSEVEK